LLQYHNRDHPDSLIYISRISRQANCCPFQAGTSRLGRWIISYMVPQELNNACVETDVSLYKHQQFVRVIEGKMNSTRLVRPE
jgi:hypothetical protein